MQLLQMCCKKYTIYTNNISSVTVHHFVVTKVFFPAKIYGTILCPHMHKIIYCFKTQ